MHIYSKRIIKFIEEIKSFTKQCLTEEIGLRVSKNRFYDLKQQRSFPIAIVVFNHKSKLGYFDSNFLELGFHECLMHTSREQLHNIIRHELAHYIMFMNYGPYISPHNPLFRTFCKERGWGEEVYSATTRLETGVNPIEIEENSILRKVQKLMALSTSCNVNESEQAMIKAQQLLLKHNIDSRYAENSVDEDEKFFLKRIMQQKKENAKMRAIASILETFFVNTIFNRVEEYIYLEVTGTAVNIEIAEYVAAVLDKELERLWEQVKNQYFHLKGMVAKNSFIQGIAIGYCNKIEIIQKGYQSDFTNSLMVIEKKLLDIKTMVYPRLSKSKSRGDYCPESAFLGQEAGYKLNINPALNKAKNSDAFLTFMK